MKNKTVIVGLIIATMLLVLSGCNKQVFDTTWSFDKAIISLPDGTVISGPVEKWTDYADGDQIQVQVGGSTYLVHSSNIVLIAGKGE